MMIVAMTCLPCTTPTSLVSRSSNAMSSMKSWLKRTMTFASSINFGNVFKVIRWTMTRLPRHSQVEHLHVDLIPGLQPQAPRHAPDVVTTAPEAIGNILVKLASASTRTMTLGYQRARLAKIENHDGTTSIPFAMIASGDKKFSHQKGAGVIDHMNPNPKLTPSQRLASLPQLMVRRLPELPKMKLLNMTDALLKRVLLLLRLPRRLRWQLDPSVENRQKTQKNNDVPEDLTKLHATEECGGNKEITLSVFTIGHSSTLVAWCASFAPIVKQLSDLHYANCTSGGGMPQSMS